MSGLVPQVIDFSLAGGVDEKTHARAAVRMLTMRNCGYREPGAISKRYGTNCIGSYDAYFGGGTPVPCELLCTVGNELVRVGRDELATYNVVGSTDWKRRSFKPEAIVYRDVVAVGEGVAYDVDVAYVSDYVAYTRLSAAINASGTAQFVVLLEVINFTTGARVYTNYVLDSSAVVTFGAPKVMVIGSTVVVVFRKGTVIRGATLNVTTMAVTAAADLPGATGVSTSSVQGIDAYALSDRFAVAYETTAGPPYIKVGTWSAALATVTAVTGIGTDQTSCLGLQGTTGETLWLAYGAITGGPPYAIKAIGLNPATLATTVALTTLSVGTSAGLVNIGVGRLTSTSCVVSWTNNNFEWAEFNTAAAVVGIGQIIKVYGVSRPFKDATTGHTYVLVMNNHATHATLFLVHMTLSEEPGYASFEEVARIVATIAPRQVPKLNHVVSNFYRGFSSLSSIATVSSGRYLIAAYTTGDSFDSVVGSLLDVRMSATKPSAGALGRMLHLSGGAPSLYDGSTVAELGFAYEPDITLATATPGVSGSLTANAKYYYLFVYEWLAEDGSIERSGPSDPANPLVATMGTNTKVTLTWPYLHLTNKQLGSSGPRNVTVAVYRTRAGGTTYHRVTLFATSYQNMNLITSSVSVNYDDTMSDADLLKQPPLYTTSSEDVPGIPANEIPPSAAHVAVMGNRVWLSATEDDSIWFSRRRVEGEVVAFNSSNVIDGFEGGRVTGMAELGEQKYAIFKADSIYLFTGEGPSDNAASGSFSEPERVAADVGCIDARSLRSTPLGIFFLSRTGLCILTRGHEVVPVGKLIEDTLGTSSIIATAIVPDQNLVRFVVDGSNKVLVFDTLNGGVAQPVWSVDTYADPVEGIPNLVAATWWTGATNADGSRGAWVHINNQGNLFQEVKTSFLDTSGGSTTYVEMSGQTSWMKLAGLQGTQRVWYAGLLGERKTDHDLVLSIYQDYGGTPSQFVSWVSGTSTGGTASWSLEQARVHVKYQECGAISVGFRDTIPSGLPAPTIGTGEGFVLSGIALEVGIERELRKLPAVQSG